jgi:hypothetical protein
MLLTCDVPTLRHAVVKRRCKASHNASRSLMANKAPAAIDKAAQHL